MKEYLKKFYHKIENFGSLIFFEKYFRKRQLQTIQGFAEDVNTILELGIGTNSYFHKIDRPYIIFGFDIFEPSLKLAKEKHFIDDYIVGDVREINKYFEEKSFDLVCAFDLIEHLMKDDGYQLIANMEKIARKRIIVYTPNGFQKQPPAPDNPFQEHLSGWSYDEMIKLGYHVIGMNGFKKLKGIYSKPIARPYFLLNFISFFTEIIFQKIKQNQLQYSILCVKDLKQDIYRK